MAIKRFRFGVTVGLHDPSADEAEVRDHVTGQLLHPFRKGLRHALPGEWVEMEEADAQKIIDRWGTYEAYEARQAIPKPAPGEPERRTIR